MNNPRILFMGTPEFACTILQSLLDHHYNVIAVVTQPDAIVGRKKILTPSPVKQLALLHNIAVYTPNKISRDYADILALKPDLIITSAYGQIIPKQLLQAPSIACINTHASLLPKYRGGAPIQRSIMNGDTYTGITLMYMNEKMDEGDILYQAKLTINDDDTSSTIFEKLADLASAMLIDHLSDIIKGNCKPVKQDNALATYAYNLKKEDEFISFNHDARLVSCHIRALLDKPGAYAVIDNEMLKFKGISYDNVIRAKASTFIGLLDSKIAIAALNGTIFVEYIQPNSKKFMDAKSFYNGYGKRYLDKQFLEHYDGAK